MDLDVKKQKRCLKVAGIYEWVQFGADKVDCCALLSAILVR